jgi:hypothetical protein
MLPPEKCGQNKSLIGFEPAVDLPHRHDCNTQTSPQSIDVECREKQTQRQKISSLKITTTVVIRIVFHKFRSFISDIVDHLVFELKSRTCDQIDFVLLFCSQDQLCHRRIQIGLIDGAPTPLARHTTCRKNTTVRIRKTIHKQRSIQPSNASMKS